MNIDKYLITEDSSSFNKTVKKIEKMTDTNNHTEAMVIGFKLLGMRDEELSAKGIIVMQDKKGELTSNLKNKRDRLYKRMMFVAKGKLSPDDYKKFNKAF